MPCDCSIDNGDWTGPSCLSVTIRKAAKDHRCCECHVVIPKGDQYEETTGVWDGRPDRFRTCLSCKYLRDTYCSGGFMYGNVLAQIEECAREKEVIQDA